jgi:hypothetical protein
MKRNMFTSCDAKINKSILSTLIDKENVQDKGIIQPDDNIYVII